MTAQASALLMDYAPALAADGIFQEWALQVRMKVRPYLFASFMLEQMRDVREGEKRAAYTALITFMKTRDWTEAASLFLPHFADADRAALAMPFAKEFYDLLRLLVVGQVESYWEEAARTFGMKCLFDPATSIDAPSKEELVEALKALIVGAPDAERGAVAAAEHAAELVRAITEKHRKWHDALAKLQVDQFKEDLKKVNEEIARIKDLKEDIDRGEEWKKGSR